MSVPADIERPTGLRLASQYKAIERKELERSHYPCTLSPLSTSIHDLVYHQSILGNEDNFAEQTTCSIFHVDGNGTGSLKPEVHDAELRYYIQSPMLHNATRIIFFTSKQQKGTTFASQISLSQTLARELLQTFEVSPHFVPLLLSEPEYAAPGTYHRYDPLGQLSRQEFICQHPRWNIHTKLQPCSVYMSFHKTMEVTTYIVVSGDADPLVEVSKQRLKDAFAHPVSIQEAPRKTPNPFFLHGVIAQESFLQSKSVITKLRHRLYDQLDVVDDDKNAKEGKTELALDRNALKGITKNLHMISQDADVLVSSTEMGTMVVERMATAHAYLRTTSDSSSRQEHIQVEDMLGHLMYSLQSRKRWILGYKSRKDIAMNLVFNLVTQQDSETNTSIARATRDDSSAMKIIAALTMVFLPATAVSGFFGMAFFDNQNGVVVMAHDWWLFIATTIPITIILVAIWQIWLSWTDLIQGLQKMRRLAIRAWSTIKYKTILVLFEGSGDDPLSIPMKDTADIV